MSDILSPAAANLQYRFYNCDGCGDSFQDCKDLHHLQIGKFDFYICRDCLEKLYKDLGDYFMN